MTNTLITERLVLRPWKISDSADLYRYAKDSRTGIPAGWQPHSSEEESRRVIEDMLSEEGVYSICLKSDGRAAGGIMLAAGSMSRMELPENEAETGFWLGVPLWGRGIGCEALKAVCGYGFSELCLSRIWARHYEGNVRSERLLKKCSFVPVGFRDGKHGVTGENIRECLYCAENTEKT